MNIITDTLDEIRKMRVRKLLLQGLNFGMIVCSALMIWKTLMVVTNTESPVVVVLSGSMEPSYYRGDILFLVRRERVIPGDIIVYQLQNEAIPIVHRVITTQELYLTHYRHRSDFMANTGIVQQCCVELTASLISALSCSGMEYWFRHDAKRRRFYLRRFSLYIYILEVTHLAWETCLFRTLGSELESSTFAIHSAPRVCFYSIYTNFLSYNLICIICFLPNKEVRILTKGDNNPVDDRGLYPRGQLWLKEEHVMGQIVGNAPYVGMLTIWLNDYPMLKWAVIGVMFLTVLVSKDPS